MHINTYINTLVPRKREKTNLIFWDSWLDLRPTHTHTHTIIYFIPKAAYIMSTYCSFVKTSHEAPS